MNLSLRLTISIIIGLAAATLHTVIKTGGLFDPVTLAAFLIATIATALASGATGSDYEDDDTGSSAADAPAPKGRHKDKRETGKVKWFNVSKGFGFIVKDDGEEIFVHFRSIRGTGRRSLKDNQRVSFVVTQGEKGPQAEDVAPE